MQCPHCQRDTGGSTTCPGCGQGVPQPSFVTQIRAKVVLAEAFRAPDWLFAWMTGMGLAEMAAAVLLVAGLLALPPAAGFLNHHGDARWRQAHATAAVVARVVSRHNQQMGRYPADQSELLAAAAAGAAPTPEVGGEAPLPALDPWGLPWVYVIGPRAASEAIFPDEARLLDGGYRLYTRGGAAMVVGARVGVRRMTGFMAVLMAALAGVAVLIALVVRFVVYGRHPERQPAIKRRLRVLGPLALLIGMLALPGAYLMAARGAAVPVDFGSVEPYVRDLLASPAVANQAATGEAGDAVPPAGAGAASADPTGRAGESSGVGDVPTPPARSDGAGGDSSSAGEAGASGSR